MDRDTTRRFTAATDQTDLTRGNACWQTPPAVFHQLTRDFGPFDLDLCASAADALCPRWFGPGSILGEDALSANWPREGRCGYANPPYGAFVPKLLSLAHAYARAGTFTTVLLLPLRVTKAFHQFILHGASELWFLDTRLTFFEAGVPRLNAQAWAKGRVVADPAMFDSIVVVYRPPCLAPLRVDTWRVPPHVFRADLDRAAARRRGEAPPPSLLDTQDGLM